MRLEDFHYELPEQLIAQQPLPDRSHSRLLCLGRTDGAVRHGQFGDLEQMLRPGDLLVFNDTRVIPARLFGHKASGGQCEILVERVLDEQHCLAQLRVSKPPALGSELLLDGGASLMVSGRSEGFWELELRAGHLSELLERCGHMPLPPYIRRADGELDRERYQTVYARRPGAVAAPTAGLHFDSGLLERLRQAGIDQAFVTLHVGAGTFQPVRCERIEEHRMHAEWLEVPTATVAAINATRAADGRVVAVGTTTLRALETAAAGGELQAYAGDSRIFIYPGHRFRAVDALITNFHLPGSTLLMLVAAFAGLEPVLAAYRQAVREQYRFFSYGDAMFIA